MTNFDFSHSSGRPRRAISLVPLEDEVRAVLPTVEAAPHIGKRPQTLRAWHMNGDGPIRAIKIGNRLLWRVSDLKALVGMA